MAEKNNKPFEIKDCTLITRMGGVGSAFNIRELRERVVACPTESLFHHFCETAIRPSFDDPEFRNDFAVWSARYLGDRVLAEKLGVLNPYSFDDIESLRHAIIDTLDERLAELLSLKMVSRGEEFLFMRAVTVVFKTGRQLNFPHELAASIADLSAGSLYYHFIEARRRTPDRVDDFTAWLRDFGEESQPMIEALSEIDFYYLTLHQLRERIVLSFSKFARSGVVEPG